MYQISIKFWITNTLLHKFFQTDMIFFDQFKVPTIKFGKSFIKDKDKYKDILLYNIIIIYVPFKNFTTIMRMYMKKFNTEKISFDKFTAYFLRLHLMNDDK